MRQWIDLFENSQSPLSATPENIARARQFIFEKWKERALERGEPEPRDLSRACKFAALFAAKIFGGEVVGHDFHIWDELSDGRALDLCGDADDVSQMRNGRIPAYAEAYARAWGLSLPSDIYAYDEDFMYSDGFNESLRSIAPRVDEWVREFLDRQT